MVDADANLTPEDAVARFSECARILRVTPMFEETTITYPVVGTTSLAVLAETAVMKVTGRGYRGARRSGGAGRRRARHSLTTQRTDSNQLE